MGSRFRLCAAAEGRPGIEEASTERVLPLQNRVTPFGDIVATPARGTLTGNRGILHDVATKTLLRRHASKAWIACTLDFRGRRRDVMGTRSWTELFFRDEATALAAGHRPCFFCRRVDALRFQAAWADGNGARLRATEIDAVLHRERRDGRSKRRHALPTAIADLPDGAMIASGADAYVIVEGQTRRWSLRGELLRVAVPADVALLTPPSTLRAMMAGYRAGIAM